MRLFIFLLFISSSAFAAQKCNLSFYQGDDLIKTKNYLIPDFQDKKQVFEEVSPKFYEDHQNKIKSTKYSVSTYVEYSSGKVAFVDFIVQRSVEEFVAGKLPASLFSQFKRSFPLERVSLRLKKAQGKKIFEIDAQKSFELSCKNS